ncbi:MAG: glycosyltransferase [bacterium]|nr:glycosyltransferase [bacterium]
MSLYFLINSLAGGGAEAVLVRIAKYLKPEKIFLLERDIKYSLEGESLIDFLSNHTKDVNSIFKTLYIPLYAMKLSRRIKDNDLILSFLERANFVNIVSKYFKRHKVLISVHIDPILGNTGLKKINTILIKTLYNKADFIITVSQGVANSLIRLGISKDKINTVHNPVFIKEITERSKEGVEEAFENRDFLITLGRLTKQKGQWHLLRIFKEVKRDFPNLRLLILGEGELKEYLVNLSQSIGFKTYVWDRDELSEDYDVYFMGFKGNPFKYIARAKLFVFPSLWEGLGNVLVEALACKTAIIASDCKSGPREILAPSTEINYQTKEPEFAKYGVLMPVLEGTLKETRNLTEREITWLEAIKMLLRDESLIKSYQEKALERAQDFDISKIIEEWHKVIRKCL